MRSQAAALAIAAGIALLCVVLTSAAAALALSRPDIEHLNANTRSQLQADYSPDARGVRFQPLQPAIVRAAQDDSRHLDAAPGAAPRSVAIVRQPTPTGTATAIATAASAPTAQTTGTPRAASATAGAATSVAGKATAATPPGAKGTPTAGPPPTQLAARTGTPQTTKPTDTPTGVPAKPTDTPIAKPTNTPTTPPTQTPVVVVPTPTPTPTPVPSGPVNTGFQSCSSNAADTAGGGNGYETNPANACADGGGGAIDATGLSLLSSCGSNADRHRFFNYGFSVPSGGSTINGVTVRIDASSPTIAINAVICVELSWNGGSSWTAAKTTPVLAASEATYLLGGATDTWGRSWGHSDFDDGKLVVRISDTSLAGAKNFNLDWVAVNVTYTP